MRRVDYRAITGATAEIARQCVFNLCARRMGVGFVQCEQGHHESRSAESALRAMLLHHGLLHRMQLVLPAKSLHGIDRLAIQGRQELYARIHGSADQPVCGAGIGPGFGTRFGTRFGNHNGAGPAVAFGATFLGTRQSAVNAQVLQHRPRGRRVR